MDYTCFNSNMALMECGILNFQSLEVLMQLDLWKIWGTHRVQALQPIICSCPKIRILSRWAQCMKPMMDEKNSACGHSQCSFGTTCVSGMVRNLESGDLCCGYQVPTDVCLGSILCHIPRVVVGIDVILVEYSATPNYLVVHKPTEFGENVWWVNDFKWLASWCVHQSILMNKVPAKLAFIFWSRFHFYYMNHCIITGPLSSLWKPFPIWMWLTL